MCLYGTCQQCSSLRNVDSESGKKITDKIMESMSLIEESFKNLEDMLQDSFSRIQRTLNFYHAKLVHCIETETIWREKKRKSQLVLFGVPESLQMDSTTQWRKDSVIVKEVLHFLDPGIQSKEVKFSHRVGKQKSGHVRPIVICFNSEGAKNKILWNAKKLKWSCYGSLKLLQDVTKQQREIFRDQMKEAHRRNNYHEGLQTGESWKVVGLRGSTQIIKINV